ncbi:MAG TPA: deoxyribodipyrimidine photo-lyase [Bacteroidia bacterium]|nr:deoxyribodipyrimidine photo-lyase [Bacteroidia bacterium]
MDNPAAAYFWFRRDLRMDDNAGLSHAFASGHPVQCIFIFDTNILDKLSSKFDPRLQFIHGQLQQIDSILRKAGGGLQTFYGEPAEVWKTIIAKQKVAAVYTNHDYEPYAIDRDRAVALLLEKNKIPFHSYKDQVIFEKDEVIKNDGTPYTVFTPYKRKWLELFSNAALTRFSVTDLKNHISHVQPVPIHSIEAIGFESKKITFAKPVTDRSTLRLYGKVRDIPSANGTSRVSMYLRFGVVSIRDLVRKALDAKSDVWLNELIWREYYMMILWHFPHVVHSAFKKQYNRIPWLNNPDAFERWCNGTTGFPIVDAGMRELNATGFMHNRVRMITASFLTKHLLTDWRWGEAYFAEKLLDFELSSNNGGWQWAAGCGCDAAPYFRIFNPAEQTKKFDPELKYIRKWVPELDSFDYPDPIIDHKFARERCLQVYKKALTG